MALAASRTRLHAAFRVGTRLYLTLPTGERVGYTFAPVQQTVNGVTFYTPSFTPDPSPLAPSLWTLSADSTKLTKAGDRFFDFQTGEAYNPTNPILADAQFTLTAPDGTIYKIHAVNGITEQQFTDGKKFILSDSGITALNGESVQFIWESSRFTSHVRNRSRRPPSRVQLRSAGESGVGPRPHHRRHIPVWL